VWYCWNNFKCNLSSLASGKLYKLAEIMLTFNLRGSNSQKFLVIRKVYSYYAIVINCWNHPHSQGSISQFFVYKKGSVLSGPEIQYCDIATAEISIKSNLRESNSEKFSGASLQTPHTNKTHQFAPRLPRYVSYIYKGITCIICPGPHEFSLQACLRC